MSATTINIPGDYDKWIRLVVAIHYGGTEICKSILCRHKSFQNAEELYKVLLNYKESIRDKLNDGSITQADYDIIFPESSSKTDTSLFNISISTCLLEVLFGSDYVHLCERLRNQTNEIFREGDVRYSEEGFQEKWEAVIKFLTQLGFNTSKIEDLKRCSLVGPSKYEQTINRLVNQARLKQQVQNNKCRIGDLTKDFQELKDDVEIMKKAINVGIIPNKKDLLCDRVWEVMYESPSFSLHDWKQLANMLGVYYCISVKRLFCRNSKKRRIIKKYLQEANITWKRLKQCLLSLKKNDIVTELCRKTNLTKDFHMTIKCHKERMSKETSRKNHQHYVDLVVADSHVIEQRWVNEIDERNFQLMKFNIPPWKFQKVSINELVPKTKHVTMINGIPGIGKTTLCEEIKYRWSNNQLWDGEIDVLLTIPCRIMNIYNFPSTADLIKHLLPDLHDVELLAEISDRVLLLLDGVDEFQNIEELSMNPSKPHLQFLKEVIDSPNQQLFSKLIITSRPKIAAFLRKFYNENLKCAVQAVEVCGFSPENIQSFIEKTFQNKVVVMKMMQKINEASTTQAMCSVPIFLKSFCTVYKEDSHFETPSTMTELLLYTLLTFFKDLYKWNGNHQKITLSLERLSTDDEVLKHIRNLAQLSHKTLAERKVVFLQEEFDGKILDELERVGFLSKSEHALKGFLYEYKHLVFQETLAALQILSVEAVIEVELYKKENFQGTIPLVSGLEGILNRSDVPKYLKALVQNVAGFESLESSGISIKSFIEKELIKEFDKHLFLNTYLFAQREYMEIPSQEFLNRITCEQFTLTASNVERSQLLEFLSFIHPHVEHLKKVDLKIYSSDNIKQLVDVSRKAKTLELSVGDVDTKKLINYFSKLSQPSEDFRVETLFFNRITTCHDSYRAEHFHFLIGVKVYILDNLNPIFILRVLEELYSTSKQLMLNKLIVTISKNEHLLAVGRLFKCVPFIRVIGFCNQTIYQYMNKDNQMKIFWLPYFPELSLTEMIFLQEVCIEFNVFTDMEREHMYSELTKLKNCEENKVLKVVKITLFFFISELAKNDLVYLIDSLDFVSNVLTDFTEEKMTATITL